MTKFVFSTKLEQPIDVAIETLKAALMTHHLGIVSDTDVSAIVKTKLDKDMPAYRILGACNPKLAVEMIEVIPEAGALLPCTIVAREVGRHTVFDFMDPEVVLAIADNKLMDSVAKDATERLKATINDLEKQ